MSLRVFASSSPTLSLKALWRPVSFGVRSYQFSLPSNLRLGEYSSSGGHRSGCASETPWLMMMRWGDCFELCAARTTV